MRKKLYKIGQPEKNFQEWEHFFYYESNRNEADSIINKVQESYLSWDEYKYKNWTTLNKEKIWSTIKLQRKTQSIATPITDEEKKLFTYSPGNHLRFLHEIDLELGGNFMGTGDFSESDKKGFIRKNLIEESIASSRLEGANTSRQAAKKLLQERRIPKSKGEQMIVNNHKALQEIESTLKNEPLSIELLLQLHQIVTHKTISENHQGKLRETVDDKGNRLVIKPWDDETIAYETPTKEFVEKELIRLVEFANQDTDHPFIHPLIKAILLHFWIGILHPFEDGNGRLARIIFYWYMLKKGYWAFSYISLSERILKSPKQYAMAFINSEQDDNDLNYFIRYNVEKLTLAKKQFQDYLKKKTDENKEVIKAIKKGYKFNERQLKLLQYLAKDEQHYTTLTTHLEINASIKKLSATLDLRKLTTEGFLEKVRNGRKIIYYPTKKVKEIFQ